MLSPAGLVSSRLDDLVESLLLEAAAAPSAPVPLVRIGPPPLTPYARSERLFRYELAVIFSLMLIVLVVVGAFLFFGH